MRIVIAAVGKLKEAEEHAIFHRYGARLGRTGKGVGIGPLDIVEVSESRASSVDQRKSEEATRLLQLADATVLKFGLDVQGKQISSEEIAALLSKHANAGVKNCTFFIGGPDGHGAEIVKQSNMMISLGRITMPHGLARVVLAEQLYRAVTILTGHPYHRA